MSSPLHELSIDSIRAGLLAKKFSAEELTRQALAFAEAENPKTNAYLTFSQERALAAAKAVDAKIAAGEDPGALAGVPIAVKDVIVTRGLRTTCGSKAAGELCSALRCDGGDPLGAGGRRDPGQDQLR